MMRWLTAIAVVITAVLLTVPVARAVEAVNVRLDAAAIDLTAATEVQHTEGDRIQVSTALFDASRCARAKATTIGRCSR
jgi:hypothetical protein